MFSYKAASKQHPEKINKMMTKTEKESLADYIIDLAKKNGANEVAVDISLESEVSLQFRDGEIEQLQESQQSGISIKVYADHKYSSHSTNDLRKDAVKQFVERAVKSTRYLTADKFRELPEQKYYPKNLGRDLNLLDSDYKNISTEDRLNIAREIHDLAKAESDKIISVAAGYGDAIFSSFKAHSNGFSGHKEGTIFSTGAEVTVKDDDARPEDYYWVQSRFKNKFPSPEFIAKKAAQGALNKIGQSKIKSGAYNMLVENRAAIKLISMLLSPLSASAIQQKSSYLDGMIGKSIASEKLNIIDNPFIAGGLGSRLFDGEGIAAKERTIIKDGVLQQYYIDSYYGKKLGMEPNGGSSSNLILNTGNQSVDEMMNRLGNGIFLTGFNGGNSNSTTGDFSFGISGFYFENGKLAKPINEMNLSGNAKGFWQQLMEVGNDPYPYSKWLVPSLVFEGVNFSGL